MALFAGLPSWTRSTGSGASGTSSVDQLVLHAGSPESFASLFNVIDIVPPDEIYHLAAQTFLRYSFEDEFSTIGTNVNGTHHVLAAMKERVPKFKFYDQRLYRQ